MATTATTKDPKSDIDQLKEDIGSIREDFAALAATTGKMAAGQFRKQTKRAGELAGSAVDTASTYREMLTDKVRDHPLAAIGIAALAGMIISSMRRH